MDSTNSGVRKISTPQLLRNAKLHLQTVRAEIIQAHSQTLPRNKEVREELHQIEAALRILSARMQTVISGEFEDRLAGRSLVVTPEDAKRP